MTIPSARTGRSTLPLLALAVTALVVLGTAVVGIAVGLQRLIGFTRAAADAVACCGTIFSSCLVSTSTLPATLPWLGMGILMVGLGLAIGRATRDLIAQRRFLQGLDLTGTKVLGLQDRTQGVSVPVIVVDRPGARQAFTAGLLAPRIYVTRELVKSLPASELTAVLIHEEHHRRRRDPLRTFVIRFLQDLLFFLPIGYPLVRIFLDAREEDADDAVSVGGGDPLDLASALCRLARLEREHIAQGFVAGLSGGTGVEGRLQRLLSARQGALKRPSPARIAASLLVGGVIVASLLLPSLLPGSPFHFRGCSPQVCAEMDCGGRDK